MNIKLNVEVEKAIETGRPVVALESTIISHGLPYPDNLDIAAALEEAVREKGVTPATIAIFDGVLHIGIGSAELARLADPKSNIVKVSRRDIPHVLASCADGATTVAATMILAQQAGISVFATGGIGGVHRGAEASFDISADLPELARTNVCVVCAGPKAILDIPLTMEVLETSGVPVIGYQCDEIPAFWSRGGSGVAAPLRLDSAAEIASLLHHKWQAGLEGGVLVTNPIAAADEIPSTELQAAISSALTQAEKEGVSGKAVTPFLLDHIRVKTGGRSLAANKALVINNARLAADIALAYHS
ncbi:MAG: pseudouridine-5'-phosphate glycosidase [Candidatus Puniceispirillaceae bacterium]